jgi:hypothetical protein
MWHLRPEKFITQPKALLAHFSVDELPHMCKRHGKHHAGGMRLHFAAFSDHGLAGIKSAPLLSDFRATVVFAAGCCPKVNTQTERR